MIYFIIRLSLNKYSSTCYMFNQNNLSRHLPESPSLRDYIFSFHRCFYRRSLSYLFLSVFNLHRLLSFFVFSFTLSLSHVSISLHIFLVFLYLFSFNSLSHSFFSTFSSSLSSSFSSYSPVWIFLYICYHTLLYLFLWIIYTK